MRVADISPVTPFNFLKQCVLAKGSLKNLQGGDNFAKTPALRLRSNTSKN